MFVRREDFNAFGVRFTEGNFVMRIVVAPFNLVHFFGRAKPLAARDTDSRDGLVTFLR
jgi:hypothetical protein